MLCLQSTVVNLLENFYAPQRGQILLDGTPLDAIDHEYLHSQISLVSQEPVLFAGTLVHTHRKIVQLLPAAQRLLCQPASHRCSRIAILPESDCVCLQRASASTSCSVCRQARK